MRDLLRLLRLYRPYRWRMLASIALSLAAVVAGAGLLALSGWFITAMAMTGLAHQTMNYFTPAALVRFFAIVRTGGRYADRLISHETTFRLLAETRTWLFARLAPLAPAAIEDLHSGDLLARLKTDVDRLELVFLRLVSPVVGALAALALVGVILGLLDLRLAMIVVAILLGFGAALPALAAAGAARESRRTAQASAHLRRILVDTLQGLAPLLAAGAQQWRRPRIDAAFGELLRGERKTARVAALGQIGTGLAADLAMIAALAVSIPLLRAAAISGPQLVMAALLALATIEALGGLPSAFASLPATLASARRIFAIADRAPAVGEPAAPHPPPARFDIRFDNVGLIYRDGSPPALADVDLSIPQGAHVAIVGRSGSGKSSLIDLLTRFREPTTGTIRIGGVSLRDLAGNAARAVFAVVPQRPHLFSATIADNLKIAAPQTTDAQLLVALRRAGLSPLLERLPDGLAAQVGVAGQALSGGEARRLAIARALLSDAPVLVLDEPGEGLDPETERALISDILEAGAGRTILLLTHSRAGLDRMDQIVRLESGRLVARRDDVTKLRQAVTTVIVRQWPQRGFMPDHIEKSDEIENGPAALAARVRAEMLDSFDEELEEEIDDERLARLLDDATDHPEIVGLNRGLYFKELFRLQRELVKLQDWVQANGKKAVVLFEGRDAAGKGGVIKRITQRLNPRVCRVVALPAPSEREKGQWYFQRYVPHLPARGEIALFDRSWYNRAGVERVMGFCTEDDVEEFFRSVPEFERMLVRSGITLIKYWFSITDNEQHFRFQMRIHDPLKQWKLSPMDLQSRVRWEAYTKAKEAMLERTHIPEAPWWVIEAVDKKRARLNCIAHLLTQFPYQEVVHPDVILPARAHNPDYIREPVSQEMYVPKLY